jgi:hypothetical protein
MKSLRLDAGGLDDRPPLLDVGFLQGAECLGRKFFARRNFHSLRADALARDRLRQGIHDRGIELGYDVLRRSLRGERRKPNRKMEARQEGARSLYECFHNVDGENLFGALITLAREGIRAKRPISFQ